MKKTRCYTKYYCSTKRLFFQRFPAARPVGNFAPPSAKNAAKSRKNATSCGAVFFDHKKKKKLRKSAQKSGEKGGKNLKKICENQDFPLSFSQNVCYSKVV